MRRGAFHKMSNGRIPLQVPKDDFRQRFELNDTCNKRRVERHSKEEPMGHDMPARHEKQRIGHFDKI